MKRLSSVLVGSLFVLSPALAAAQEAMPPPRPVSAPPSVGSDVVKLRDGSMYRGVILELVANDHVDVRVASGEVKRFALKDVTYAGPEPSLAPPSPPVSPPPPPPPRLTEAPRDLVPGPMVRARLVADEPDIVFSRRSGSATVVGFGGGYSYVGVAHSYDDLCSAPCEVSLPVGSHRLALSKQARGAVEAETDVRLDGPSTVRATYHDRRGQRIAGWITLFGGELASAVLIATSVQTGQDCSSGTCVSTSSLNTAQTGIGVGVGVASAVVGLVLIWQRDGAEFSVSPLQPGPMPRVIGPAREAGAASTPEGLQMKVTF